MSQTAFLLRIPTDLHQSLKEAVAYEKTTITQLITKLVEKEVERIIQKRNAEIRDQNLQ
jgi:predicted transcriptional regulator